MKKMQSVQSLQPLSNTEAFYLDWIMHRIRCYQCPTHKELASYFEVSRATAAKHMRALVEKGYLQVVESGKMQNAWTPLVGVNWHIVREAS